MTEKIARQIVLAARPQGRPKLSDFRLEETAIPTPSAGQVLLRVQYLSLDPYMRGRMDDRKSYATPVPLGGVMQGESVATVIASKHPGYSEGDIVLAQTGWRTHALSDRADLRKLDPAVAPVTTGLGVLGMPGFTAYGGLRVIGKPEPGETVVVAAASGPVGSLVGQLAKICRRQGGRHRGRPREVRLCEGRAPLRRGDRSPRLRFRRQARGGLPGRHRCLLRERRRGDLAGGVAVAKQVRARPGLRPDRAVQRRGKGRRHRPAARHHARDPVEEPDGARLHQLRICRRALSPHSCARSVPASPMAASVIARTSSTVWRTRPKLSSACWKDATSAS